MLGRVWRREKPPTLWGQRAQQLQRTGRSFLKDTGTELPYDPAASLLGICLGGRKTLTGKDKCTPKFIVGLLTIAKMWKQTAYWQVNGWRCGVYLMECDSAIKEWDIAVCSNTDGPRDYHNKWSKSKTYIIWYHLHVESKKMILIYSVFVNEWTYLQNRKNFTDIEKQI